MVNTQPTIETLLVKLDESKTHFDHRFDRLEYRIQMVEEKMSVVNDELLTIKAEIRQVQRQGRELVTTLESTLPTQLLG